MTKTLRSKVSLSVSLKIKFSDFVSFFQDASMLRGRPRFPVRPSARGVRPRILVRICLYSRGRDALTCFCELESLLYFLASSDFSDDLF